MTQDQKSDPDRSRIGQPFDRADGYSGQDYHRDEEAARAADMPTGSVSDEPSRAAADAVLPPDNGRRASFDPETGEVHGSGSGIGGGNPGEDMDSDAGGGDGRPRTGAGS